MQKKTLGFIVVAGSILGFYVAMNLLYRNLTGGFP